jgi:hypothetical protein
MTNPIINYPPFLSPLNINFFTTILTQDTAGEQVFAWGTPTSESWTSGTKEITGVEVVYAQITANSASVWNVSLQALSSSGNPIKPTGIPLAVWSGSVTSSTFVTDRPITHSFTSSYTIPTGSKLGVVFKYDTFVAPTTINIRSFASKGEFNSSYGLPTSTTTGSTWSVGGSGIISMRFLCSDNTKLFFEGALNAMSRGATTAATFTSTSTGTGLDSGDERGVLWVPKKTYDITNFQFVARLGEDPTVAELRMYRDTNLLASRTITPMDNPDTGTSYGYWVNFSTPIRVYPNDNIRFTQLPISSSLRHTRFTFDTPTDMQNYFGGEDDETNFSYTNRVDGGAWNTPSGAESSSVLLQLYGTEVTGSALIEGVSTISGSVLRAGQPASGARIFAMRQSDGVVATTSSANDGTYTLNLTSSAYHVFAEYESDGQLYNALSAWNVQPV